MYDIKAYKGELNYLCIGPYKTIAQAKRASKELSDYRGSRITIIDWIGATTVAEKVEGNSYFHNYRI